jgi:hypothetical protein
MPRASESLVAVAVTLPPETLRVLSSPASFHWDYSDIGFENLTRQTEMELDDEAGRIEYAEVTLRVARDAATFGPEFYKALQEMDRQLSRRESNLLVIEVATDKEEGESADD